MNLWVVDNKMSLRSIFKEVRRTLTFWIPISEPPDWVWKAYNRWCDGLSARPYGMTKHFVGKNNIYRVYCEMVGQGPVLEHWYRKKRIR